MLDALGKTGGRVRNGVLVEGGRDGARSRLSGSGLAGAWIRPAGRQSGGTVVVVVWLWPVKGEGMCWSSSLWSRREPHRSSSLLHSFSFTFSIPLSLTLYPGNTD